MQVGKNKAVSVHYVLQVEHNGEKVVADKSDLEHPLQYLHGAGSLLPEFEANLEGLQVGDAFDFKIEAANGYGIRDEQNVVAIPLEAFKDEAGNVDNEMLQTGNILPMMDQEGNRLEGMVLEVTDEQVIMDFNHPLASKDLYFSGSVAGVREATADELEHGHIHGPGGHHHH
ncbi:MAG: FKBP-type peptidyl-prolyl cis-trans isomerase [Chitinophagales bacterium]|nr:FKBP-type peptidyl-prolyl cis-trans isomerase [Chitinophagales bacterium]